MKNQTKLKGITIIRVDSIETDSSAKVSEVLSGNEAGVKVFGFLAKAAVKAIKVLAPKLGLQVVDTATTEANPEVKVETKTEAEPETKTESKPEPEIKSKVQQALNPETFDYTKVFNSDYNKKKRKEKHNQDVDDALEELRKFKEELRKKYKF